MNQMNLHSPFWKEGLKYLGWVLLAVFLWFRGCSSSEIPNVIAKVIIPEVKGKFEPKKPVHEPILIQANSPQLKNGKTIFVENQINKKLLAETEKLKADFAKANDSIKQLSFEKAIQINSFSTDFEDDNIVIDINGIVRGEVQEITPAYTIKQKTVAVPVKVKETVFRVLAGGAIGVNKEINQFAYGLNLNFQNRKGNIISAEYLNIGNQEFAMVGYKQSIFNIRR